MSVPNQYCAPGARRRRIGETASGSAVPSHGAASAIVIISSNTTAPKIAVGWRRKASLKRNQVGEIDRGALIATAAMSVPDARIDQRVAEINQQVDDHVQRREQQRHALDDRF